MLAYNKADAMMLVFSRRIRLKCMKIQREIYIPFGLISNLVRQGSWNSKMYFKDGSIRAGVA